MSRARDGSGSPHSSSSWQRSHSCWPSAPIWFTDAQSPARVLHPVSVYHRATGSTQAIARASTAQTSTSANLTCGSAAR